MTEPKQTALDFTAHAPYQKHSETSKAAARVISFEAKNLRLAVLAYLKLQGARGATDEEIQNGLRLNPSTQRPRRVELVERGQVVDSGQRRRTGSGRAAVVWITAYEFMKRF